MAYKNSHLLSMLAEASARNNGCPLATPEDYRAAIALQMTKAAGSSSPWPVFHSAMKIIHRAGAYETWYLRKMISDDTGVQLAKFIQYMDRVVFPRLPAQLQSLAIISSGVEADALTTIAGAIKSGDPYARAALTIEYLQHVMTRHGFLDSQLAYVAEYVCDTMLPCCKKHDIVHLSSHTLLMLSMWGLLEPARLMLFLNRLVKTTEKLGQEYLKLRWGEIYLPEPWHVSPIPYEKRLEIWSAAHSAYDMARATYANSVGVLREVWLSYSNNREGYVETGEHERIIILLDHLLEDPIAQEILSFEPPKNYRNHNHMTEKTGQHVRHGLLAIRQVMEFQFADRRFRGAIVYESTLRFLDLVMNLFQLKYAPTLPTVTTGNNPQDTICA